MLSDKEKVLADLMKEDEVKDDDTKVSKDKKSEKFDLEEVSYEVYMEQEDKKLEEEFDNE